MPQIDPKQPVAEVTPFDVLDMKRKIFTFAEKHGLPYRDYGNYVGIGFPSHKPMYATTNKVAKEGADIDAAIHVAKYREQRAKDAPRPDKKSA